MRRLAAEQVWPDKALSRRRFDAAAAGFADSAFVVAEARQRLWSRLDFLRPDPALVLDLGCGHGEGARALRRRYPLARTIGIDSSAAMLAHAAVASLGEGIALVRGDAERIPIREGTVNLLFANMVVPWCRPELVFAEAARVIAEEGLFLFSTLGPDTLGELRRAWRQFDDSIHVHGFLDMHDLGDMLAAAGFAEPVMDVDRLTVTYSGLDALAADLRAAGARNSAPARRRSLTPPRQWRQVERLLTASRADGRLGVTVELVFGQAWGRGPAAQREVRGGEISVPVEHIRRR